MGQARGRMPAVLVSCTLIRSHYAYAMHVYVESMYAFLPKFPSSNPLTSAPPLTECAAS